MKNFKELLEFKSMGEYLRVSNDITSLEHWTFLRDVMTSGELEGEEKKVAHLEAMRKLRDSIVKRHGGKIKFKESGNKKAKPRGFG